MDFSREPSRLHHPHTAVISPSMSYQRFNRVASIILFSFTISICFGCGGEQYRIKSGDGQGKVEGKIQITSEPAGARVEVFEIKRGLESSYDEKTLPPASYQGVTPMEITLDLIGADKRDVVSFYVKYEKDGYLPEIRTVNLSSEKRTDTAMKTAAKATEVLMVVLPIMLIPSMAFDANKTYTELSIPTAPVHVSMEPISPTINIASRHLVTCLMHYINIAEHRDNDKSDKNSLVKLTPRFCL